MFGAKHSELDELAMRAAGIVLTREMRSTLAKRLERRVRSCRYKSLRHYIESLTKMADDAPEWQEFVNCMLARRTNFFPRDLYFDEFAKMLPKLAAVRSTNSASFAPLRIWYLPCNGGEEAFSIAILASEFARKKSEPIPKVLVTGMTTTGLHHARLGKYRLDRLASVPEALRDRYFVRAPDGERGVYIAGRNLRSPIEFRFHNPLVEPRWLRAEIDIIFVRDLFGLYPRKSQLRIADNLAGALVRGGTVFTTKFGVGFEGSKKFCKVTPTIFQRV